LGGFEEDEEGRKEGGGIAPERRAMKGRARLSFTARTDEE